MKILKELLLYFVLPLFLGVLINGVGVSYIFLCSLSGGCSINNLFFLIFLIPIAIDIYFSKLIFKRLTESGGKNKSIIYTIIYLLILICGDYLVFLIR
jgi:hypothetical protein